MTIVKKTRGRPPAFDRHEVLERAMQVFSTAGYDGASIPMLTEATGISLQSRYAAFGSKEALYREALAFYSTTIGGSPSESARPKSPACCDTQRNAGSPGYWSSQVSVILAPPPVPAQSSHQMSSGET
jgi:hypothetical protein